VIFTPIFLFIQMVARYRNQRGKVSQIVRYLNAITRRGFSFFDAGSFRKKLFSFCRAEKGDVGLQGYASYLLVICRYCKSKIRQHKVGAAHDGSHGVAVEILDLKTAGGSMVADGIDDRTAFVAKRSPSKKFLTSSSVFMLFTVFPDISSRVRDRLR
jgi:hypothetical protein